jgi:hypothetical protein
MAYRGRKYAPPWRCHQTLHSTACAPVTRRHGVDAAPRARYRARMRVNGGRRRQRRRLGRWKVDCGTTGVDVILDMAARAVLK